MSLRSERKKTGLKQGDIAELIGISQQRLSHFETGLRQPKADILKKLSKVYNCSIDELLEDDNEPRKKRTRRKVAKTA